MALSIGKLDVFPGMQAFIWREMVLSATEFISSTIKRLKIRIAVSTHWEFITCLVLYVNNL